MGLSSSQLRELERKKQNDPATRKKNKMNLIENKIEEKVKAELTPFDVDSAFADMLDELYSFDSVGEPFEGLLPSRVLKECDETAFRCGVNDYADSLCKDGRIEEIAGDYYDADEVQTIRDEVEEEWTTDDEE